ncbi:MAG: DinB family protein [Bacteroidota bacterium]
MQATDFTAPFLQEIQRRLFEECWPRLEKCLAQLTEAEIWQRPNENSNSIGNITLHLCGNLRQWVVAGLGKAEDIRQRQQEFDERGPLPTKLLLEKMHETMMDVQSVLDKVSTEDLLAMHQVQGFQESGIAILVHVTEHYSYHVGQMTYFVKAIKDMDIGYYANVDLEAK